MKITKLLTLSILALSSIFILTGCNTQTVVEGDTITVSYDSYLQDGKIIANGEEVTFIVGMGQTFPIFDIEVIDMKKGEIKDFTATVEEGYGIYHDNNKVQDITTVVFNKIGSTPQAGETIELGDMKGLVLEVGPITNKIDFNEPQTRETVEFKIEVIDIVEAEKVN